MHVEIKHDGTLTNASAKLLGVPRHTTEKDARKACVSKKLTAVRFVSATTHTTIGRITPAPVIVPIKARIAQAVVNVEVDAIKCSYTKAVCNTCRGAQRTRMNDRHAYHAAIQARLVHAGFVVKHDPNNTGMVGNTPVWAMCPCSSCVFLSR